MGDFKKVITGIVLRLNYSEVSSLATSMAIRSFPRICSWIFPGEVVSPVPQPPTHVTKLKSGITVVTNDFFDVSNPTANPKVGLYLKRGSIHETKESKGAFRMLRFLFGNVDANKSVSKKTHTFSFDNKIGKTMFAEERTFFFSSVNNTSEISSAVDFYHDMIKHPLFTKEALQTAKEKYFAEFKKQSNEEIEIMKKLILSAAFPDYSLSFLMTESHADHITPNILYKAIEDHFVGENMVLVASGIEHFQFVNICNNVFFNFPSHSPNSPSIVLKYNPKSIYITEQNDRFENFVFVCVGTELFPKNLKESVMAKILLELIKENTFLYPKTERRHVFHRMYNGTGLLGIMGKTTPEEANETALKFLSLFRSSSHTLSEKKFMRLKVDEISGIYLKATQDYCSDDSTIINKVFHRKLIQLESDNFELKNHFQEEIDALDKITYEDFCNFVTSALNKRDLCMGVGARTTQNLLRVQPIETLQAVLDDIENGVVNTK